MNHYLICYPRDFDNEYEVYAGSDADLSDLESFLDRPNRNGNYPTFQRLTWAQAIRRGWTLPREAKRDGEQWFGGFAEPYAGPSWHHGRDYSVRDAIADAATATTEELDRLRTMAKVT